MSSKEFEIARLAVIDAAKAGEIDQARGFAWAHRIHPLNATPLEEVFADDFHVSKAQRDEVLEMVDKAWRAGKTITFYDIEGVGGDGVELGRMDIVAVLRAACLSRLFDSKIWKALIEPGSGPIESQGLADKFSADEDLIY